MRLAEFIRASSSQIVQEWEEFARTCTPAARSMDVTQRRDHVAGMLQAIAADLETPQSTREQSEDRSLGLGLYIVQAIVVAHGGTIDVSSDEHGTTFTVGLPCGQ